MNIKTSARASSGRPSCLHELRGALHGGHLHGGHVVMWSRIRRGVCMCVCVCGGGWGTHTGPQQCAGPTWALVDGCVAASRQGCHAEAERRDQTHQLDPCAEGTHALREHPCRMCAHTRGRKREAVCSRTDWCWSKAWSRGASSSLYFETGGGDDGSIIDHLPSSKCIDGRGVSRRWGMS